MDDIIGLGGMYGNLLLGRDDYQSLAAVALGFETAKKTKLEK